MAKLEGCKSAIEKLEKIIDEVVEQREAAWADAERGRALVRDNIKNPTLAPGVTIDLDAWAKEIK